MTPSPTNDPIAIASRLELFVDRLLLEQLQDVDLCLHTPQPQPLAAHPLRGAYLTVFQDGWRYRAYYREYAAWYQGERFDGNEGETTRYAESLDGREWTFPELGLVEVDGDTRNNAILAQRPPFCHNFAPFLDANPQPAAGLPYKALAGTHPGGLHAFGSADGIRWQPLQDDPVLNQEGFAFDSQNVSFWSPVEQCYVCYFRTWETSAGRLRTISRATSTDYLHWSAPVALDPNLPDEHLYVSGTHPYFRAPHIYVATPTRFHPDRGDSTDILFMATRAGATRYERLFTEALIRPGLDPARWGNRANYAACGIVPTGPAEMSLYHCHSGVRYTLRPDGFISLRAGFAAGQVLTRPLLFAGQELVLNASTSAAGSLRAELQDASGRPLPGFGLEACDPFVGDAIEQVVRWQGDPDLGSVAGQAVRLRLALQECDVFSMRFR